VDDLAVDPLTAQQTVAKQTGYHDLSLPAHPAPSLLPGAGLTREGWVRGDRKWSLNEVQAAFDCRPPRSLYCDVCWRMGTHRSDGGVCRSSPRPRPALRAHHGVLGLGTYGQVLPSLPANDFKSSYSNRP
jgi:hypothetical protein